MPRSRDLAIFVPTYVSSCMYSQTARGMGVINRALPTTHDCMVKFIARIKCIEENTESLFSHSALYRMPIYRDLVIFVLMTTKTTELTA